jgi:hypothetical protein
VLLVLDAIADEDPMTARGLASHQLLVRASVAAHEAHPAYVSDECKAVVAAVLAVHQCPTCHAEQAVQK